MTAAPTVFPPPATVEEVADSLRRNLGAEVHEVRRQTRWRPTWFVRAERDGAPFDVVVRGERVDTQVFPLRHEFAFHGVLADHGIPVPRLHGWLDDIGAVCMEMVAGRPDFADVPETERDVIVDEYLQVLARIHTLPIEPFVAAGVHRGSDPARTAMIGHDRMEQLYRAKKDYPDPFMEFCLGWLHRHEPQSGGREAPVPWDTGQFHHHGGHLVAILDLEFGHVGDPLLDLAVWRMRDTLIPFGDFPSLYARYSDLTGTEVDMETIKRHHFGATLGNELMFGPSVRHPNDETDLMNNMQWDSETNLHATEFLGEYLGVELPEVETPEPRRTRADATYDHLVRVLRRLGTSEQQDELTRHRLRLAFRTARHLMRHNEIGDAVVEADLDDLRPVLGYRPETWWEGDEALERFVLADAARGEHDETLVRLFHRRNLRAHLQLGPEGSAMVAHYPTQRFS
jgi:aminoglycoside phosphotransferase (APT) family kinase protein